MLNHSLFDINVIIAFILVINLNSKLYIQSDDIGSWRYGTIHLKDGTSQSGLVKFGNSGGTLTGLQSFKTISFKADDKAKKIKIKKDNIDFFTQMSLNGNEYKYTYIPIKKKKTILVKVLVEGTASLYLKVLTPYNTSFDASNPQTYAPSNLQYVMIKGKPYASTLFMPNVTKSFKKEASSFFNSCPSLVSKIEDGTLDILDSEDIVTVYNSCF